jgi:hypothetical protein
MHLKIMLLAATVLLSSLYLQRVAQADNPTCSCQWNFAFATPKVCVGDELSPCPAQFWSCTWTEITEINSCTGVLQTVESPKACACHDANPAPSAPRCDQFAG